MLAINVMTRLLTIFATRLILNASRQNHVPISHLHDLSRHLQDLVPFWLHRKRLEKLFIGVSKHAVAGVTSMYNVMRADVDFGFDVLRFGNQQIIPDIDVFKRFGGYPEICHAIRCGHGRGYEVSNIGDLVVEDDTLELGFLLGSSLKHAGHRVQLVLRG